MAEINEGKVEMELHSFKIRPTILVQPDLADPERRRDLTVRRLVAEQTASGHYWEHRGRILNETFGFNNEARQIVRSGGAQEITGRQIEIATAEALSREIEEAHKSATIAQFPITRIGHRQTETTLRQQLNTLFSPGKDNRTEPQMRTKPTRRSIS